MSEKWGPSAAANGPLEAQNKNLHFPSLLYTESYVGSNETSPDLSDFLNQGLFKTNYKNM